MSSIINRGPWILTIADKTRVVLAESAHDGGMVEFYDAVTHEPAGSAGINWWLEAGHKVLYHGSLPERPVEFSSEPDRQEDMNTLHNYLDWQYAVHGSFRTLDFHRQLVREERPMPSIVQAREAIARLRAS